MGAKGSPVIWAKDGGWHNIIDYGAASGGSAATNTSAINAAISAAQSTGGTVYIPAGSYDINSALTTVTGKVMIAGDGMLASKITQTTISANTFTFNTSNQFNVRDLRIDYSGNSGSGTSAGIYAAGGSDYSRIANVAVWGGMYGIHIYRATWFVIDGVHTQQALDYGIYVRSAGLGDAGDSTICNSHIQAKGATGNSVCLGIGSSGGLRVINNKIQYGYRCVEIKAVNDVSAGLNSIVIASNTMDNACTGGYSIYVSDNSSGVAVNTLSIVGNNEVTGGIHIDGTSIANMYGINITGNTMFPAGEGHTNTASIQITHARWVSVVGNLMRKQDDDTPTYGIYADSTDSDVQIAGNHTSTGFATAQMVIGRCYGSHMFATQFKRKNGPTGTWTAI